MTSWRKHRVGLRVAGKFSWENQEIRKFYVGKSEVDEFPSKLESSEQSPQKLNGDNWPTSIRASFINEVNSYIFPTNFPTVNKNKRTNT